MQKTTEELRPGMNVWHHGQARRVVQVRFNDVAEGRSPTATVNLSGLSPAEHALIVKWEVIPGTLPAPELHWNVAEQRWELRNLDGVHLELPEAGAPAPQGQRQVAIAGSPADGFILYGPGDSAEVLRFAERKLSGEWWLQTLHPLAGEEQL